MLANWFSKNSFVVIAKLCIHRLFMVTIHFDLTTVVADISNNYFFSKFIVV